MAPTSAKLTTPGKPRPTAVERRYLDRQLQSLRSLESRTRGLYAECLVADALGSDAHQAESVISSWDICWEGISIAVRCTGSWNSETLPMRETGQKPSSGGWSFSKRSTWVDDKGWSRATKGVWTDVVVLAFHKGTTIGDGWSFYVVAGSKINALAPKRISRSRAEDLASRHRAVSFDEMQAAVREIKPAMRKGAGLYPTRCEEHGLDLRPPERR